MMDYNMMTGVGGGNMVFFAWIPYVLTVVLLTLGIFALLKYISKK